MNRVREGIVGVDFATREIISKRYRKITKAVNLEFWNCESEMDHSLYVGSYGRGTATLASDLDVLISLPREEYFRYDSYRGNGQSRLLQAVKSAILATYPTTDIKADGQVIVASFSDGMKFEILPAFDRCDFWGLSGGFDYPDSNMGGRWLATYPKTEQEAMRGKNKESNGLLFDTCKHIRNIHKERFSSYKLSGIVIDSFVFSAIGNWRWIKGGSLIPAGAYEENLLEEFNRLSGYGLFPFSLKSPGGVQAVDTEDSYSCLGKVLRTTMD